MLRFILYTALLFIIHIPAKTQGILEGNDPLGRPYRPVFGTLAPLFGEDVPQDIGSEVSKRFYACVTDGGAFGSAPYTIVDKTKLDRIDRMTSQGMTKEALRKYYYWALLGSQALIRLEINSFHQYVIEDSVFTKDTHIFWRMENYTVIDINASVRFSDVTTSKILKYDNFYITVNSKDYTPFTKLKEDVFLHNKLIEATCQKSQEIFKGMLASSAVIDSVFQKDGEKAKIVLVNDAPMTAYCKKGTLFYAYAIEKFYKVDDQVFPHVNYVGQIEKANDYNYKLAKFNVLGGKKEMLEMMDKGATLICATGKFPLPAFAPSTARTSVIFDDFKTSASAKIRDSKAKVIRDACLDAMASRPLLIDALDREVYDLIEKEKRVQMRTKSDATQGGISIGSELLLTGEIVSYDYSNKINYLTAEDTQKKTAPAQKSEKGKSEPKKEEKKEPTATVNKTPVPKIPKSVTYSINLTLNLKATNIATGEAAFEKTYKMGGSSEVPYIRANGNYFNVEQADAIAFKQVSDNLAKNMWSDIFYNVTPKLHLLDILETSKEEAETVLIGGGTMSGFLPGTPMEVVEVTTEDVQGQKLERETVVSRLRMKEVREATTICKVRDGGKELARKVKNGANLYVRLGY